MKRWMLTEPAFIGAALLASGSIITENDLPETKERDSTGKVRGEAHKSLPPRSAVEINSKGEAVSDDDDVLVEALGLSARPTEIAAVSPHGPNPDMPQALPPHRVGEVLPAGEVIPAPAIETDEEHARRVAQADKIANATAPKRRGS